MTEMITIPKEHFERMVQQICKPPVVYRDVKEIEGTKIDLSPGAVNCEIFFTVEGFKRLLLENEELREQVREIKSILGIEEEEQY